MSDSVDLTCCSSQAQENNTWIHGNNSYSFEVKELRRSIEDLKSKEKFDLIFISFKSFPDFRRSLYTLKEFVHPDSLIIIDGSLGICFELIVHECLPNLTTFTFFIDIGVECIDGEFKSSKENFDLLFGYTCFEKYKISNDSISIEDYKNLAINYLLKKDSKLSLISNKLKNTKIIENEEDNLLSYIWLNLILVITGKFLPITFDELNVQRMLLDSSIRPIFKNLVNELVFISNKFVPFKKFLTKTFNNSNIVEIIAIEISKKKKLSSNGINDYTLILLFQIILISDSLSISNPNLTFLYGFLFKLLKPNKAEQAEEEFYIDQELAELYLAAEEGEEIKQIQPKNLYKEEERLDLTEEVNYSTSSSSKTVDGIDTIDNEISLKEFELPGELKPMEATNHSNKFHVNRIPYKHKKVRPLLPRRFEPIRLQRAEYLSYKEYSNRHFSIFNSFGGKFEEGNRDRYGEFATSSKSTNNT